MKKRIIAAILAGTMVMSLIVTGCGKEAAPATDTASESEITEVAAESEAVQDVMTFMSPDGYQIKYRPEEFACNEIDEHTQSFVFIGESAGTNMVTVYYKEGVGPEEVLGEITGPWGDQEKILRTQSWFPGTDDKWGFTRQMEAEGPAGSKIDNCAIAGEYNGGTLLFEFLGHRSGDEENDMMVSDALSEIVNSITYDDFKDQEMFSYYPGVYKDVKNDTYSVELNDDHFGMLHFQDDVQIIWGSDYVMTTDGQNKYEFTIEGDSLYLREDEFGDFREYTKGDIAKIDDGGATPAYVYGGDDEKDKAVHNYMANEIGSIYPETDVKIPFCQVVHVDDLDENNVKVYGSFWVNGYNRDGDTLFCKNGGQHVGCFHLKKNDDLSYTVISFDQAKDGSYFTSSAKEIFGDYYSTLEKVMGDEETREMIRKEEIKNYVIDNQLSIKEYEDYGWMPESLFD